MVNPPTRPRGWRRLPMRVCSPCCRPLGGRRRARRWALHDVARGDETDGPRDHPRRQAPHLKAFHAYAAHAQEVVADEARTAVDPVAQRCTVGDWLYWKHLTGILDAALSVAPQLPVREGAPISSLTS